MSSRGAASIVAAESATIGHGDEKRDPAGARDRAQGVARAEGVADAHARGLAEAERDHERGRGDLQHDRVRLERSGADQAHRQPRRGEDRDLRRDRRADRQAEAPQTGEGPPIRPPKA